MVVGRLSSLVALLLLAICAAVWAQGSGDVEGRVKTLQAVSPKAVVLVFDISGSMGSNEMLSRSREAVIRMLRSGLKPGDTFAVFTFDTAARKAAERVIGAGGVEPAVQEVPGELSDKAGTNIRWAHHEALQWVEQKRPKQTFMILVTDSYNDPPAAADPARKEYGAYYRPETLTKYPDSPENRDYERLLKRRQALGITEWGIGVGINPSTGRPIERYPAPLSAETSSAAAHRPHRIPNGPPIPPPPRSSHAWVWIAAIAAGLAIAAALWSLASKPLAVSLAESPRTFRNYRVRPGAVIRIGGAGAAEDDLAYPIPGTVQPVAAVRRVGSGFRLEPGTGAGPAVLLNQEPLKAPAPIAPGDEIKVRMDGSSPAPPRELRLEFGRARAEDA